MREICLSGLTRGEAVAIGSPLSYSTGSNLSWLRLSEAKQRWVFRG